MKAMGTAKWAFVAGFMVTGLVACNAQDKKPKQDPAKPPGQALTVDTPQVSVRMNKQYDDSGNLVRYDSTYTRVYNSMGGDSLGMDSLMQAFRSRFGGPGPMLGMDGFNDLFFRDSLLHYDFFHDDFFRKRMEMNRQYMDRMMQRMDSLKNRFFQEAPPNPRQGREGTL